MSVKVVRKPGCIERVLGAKSSVGSWRWTLNPTVNIVAVGISVAIELCGLHFSLFSCVVSFWNVVRDDTDTIELAHQSNLASNCFGRGNIYIGRDANWLTETKVTQEKVRVSTKLAWICMK